MKLDLLRITGVALPHGIEPLAAIAAGEEFGMVDRLINHFRDGSNTFARRGESLWVARQGGRLIAVGGVNVDPYFDDAKLARLRHVYVHPDFRRSGVGRRLVSAIETDAAPFFQTFQLFTANPVAARFYESLGYLPVRARWKVSHTKFAIAS